MAKNPIFLTEQELIKGLALLTSNALLVDQIQESTESLSKQETLMMQILFLCPNHSAKEIASRMHISKQSFSRHLRNLHQKNFVVVCPDPDDKRVKRLLLSTKGLEYYTNHQRKILSAFYSAYQTAGLSAVEGFHSVQNALAQSLNMLSR